MYFWYSNCRTFFDFGSSYLVFSLVVLRVDARDASMDDGLVSELAYWLVDESVVGLVGSLVSGLVCL